MAQDEIVHNMKKLFVLAALLAPLLCGAQQVEWSRTRMDGSRTGCSAPGADNVVESLGSVRGRRYFAPDGKIYRGGTVTATAAEVLAAQPAMADVKTPVGFCPEGMNRRDLYDFATDILMDVSYGLFGKGADIAILNSGGIRADMPKGEVLKDDMLAIFPFHNKVVLVQLKGQDLLATIERVFGRRPQPFSGVELTYRDGALASVTMKGKEIDPEATYYLCTVDFLLGGGDRMRLATGAQDIKYSELDVIDVVLEHMAREKAAGRNIEAVRDGRLTMEGEGLKK